MVCRIEWRRFGENAGYGQGIYSRMPELFEQVCSYWTNLFIHGIIRHISSVPTGTVANNHSVMGESAMPKAKYEQLFQILKEKIESGQYAPQELLPSEHTLIAELGCSRNTLRRAVGELVRVGYVQTIQGKGVRNIFEPAQQATFTLGTIESFAESAARNGWRGTSAILLFSELTANASLAAKTGFAEGTPLYYIQRLHYLNDRPLIINHSYFRQDIACGLTREIAEQSIYRYLEGELHLSIINSKRVVTVEKATLLDLQYLDMGDCNCLAVVSSQTYNSDGVMFEYTQSRHQPNFFRFQDNAVRRPAAQPRAAAGGTTDEKE